MILNATSRRPSPRLSMSPVGEWCNYRMARVGRKRGANDSLKIDSPNAANGRNSSSAVLNQAVEAFRGIHG